MTPPQSIVDKRRIQGSHSWDERTLLLLDPENFNRVWGEGGIKNDPKGRAPIGGIHSG